MPPEKFSPAKVKNLKTLLSKSKVEEFFAQLGDDLIDDFVLIQSQFSELKKKSQREIISQKNYKLEFNKIIVSLLEILNENAPSELLKEKPPSSIDSGKNFSSKEGFPAYIPKLETKSSFFFKLEKTLFRQQKKYKPKMGKENSTGIISFWFLREKRISCEGIIDDLKKLDLSKGNGYSELTRIIKSIDKKFKPLFEILVESDNTNHYVYTHTEKMLKSLQTAKEYHYSIIRNNDPKSTVKLKGAALPKLMTSIQILHNTLSELEDKSTQFSSN